MGYYPIQLNDMVLVPNPDAKTKIDKEFVGPYRVVEIFPYGNILTDNGGRFNQNQVKKIQDKITSENVENINALYELPMTKSGGSVAPNTINQSVIGCYLDQNDLINLVNSKQDPSPLIRLGSQSDDGACLILAYFYLIYIYHLHSRVSKSHLRKYRIMY
eukprot:NODE_1062_length_2379_cov_0.228947.p2 type:complete len:160 gc:universal NODE_1062_length_2379_cov_0.228947:1550-2029(+)